MKPEEIAAQIKEFTSTFGAGPKKPPMAVGASAEVKQAAKEDVGPLLGKKKLPQGPAMDKSEPPLDGHSLGDESEQPPEAEAEVLDPEHFENEAVKLLNLMEQAYQQVGAKSPEYVYLDKDEGKWSCTDEDPIGDINSLKADMTYIKKLLQDWDKIAQSAKQTIENYPKLMEQAHSAFSPAPSLIKVLPDFTPGPGASFTALSPILAQLQEVQMLLQQAVEFKDTISGDKGCGCQYGLDMLLSHLEAHEKQGATFMLSTLTDEERLLLLAAAYPYMAQHCLVRFQGGTFTTLYHLAQLCGLVFEGKKK